MMQRMKTWARNRLYAFLGLNDMAARLNHVAGRIPMMDRVLNDMRRTLARMTTGFVDVHQMEPTVVLLASRAGNGGNGMIRMYKVDTADERKLRQLMADLEHLCGHVYSDMPPQYRWHPTLDRSTRAHHYTPPKPKLGDE